MSPEKVTLEFLTITNRIQDIDFPDVDIVIGIATGGIVPASLVAFHLKKDLEIIQFNYRDEDNTPLYAVPKLISGGHKSLSGKKILLVDDVSVSGKTLEAARGQFPENEVFTLVMKGKADISAFSEISNCVNWPWKIAVAEKF